ncbi:MAG: hypothetical protein CMJ24_00780 [Phycisphaerae bacterium]|nr:hypothetical protein [Phycisphaerae bacterium]
MKKRSLLLKFIAANLCIFVLAWILIPSDPDESRWSTPPLIVLVVTILCSVTIWNFTFTNDRVVEQ